MDTRPITNSDFTHIGQYVGFAGREGFPIKGYGVNCSNQLDTSCHSIQRCLSLTKVAVEFPQPGEVWGSENRERRKAGADRREFRTDFLCFDGAIFQDLVGIGLFEGRDNCRSKVVMQSGVS